MMTCMVSFRPRGRGHFLHFLGDPVVFNANCVFLAVNASLHWLNNG